MEGNKRQGSPLDREAQKTMRSSSDDLNASIEDLGVGGRGGGAGVGGPAGCTNEGDDRLKRQLLAVLRDPEIIATLSSIITNPLKAEIAKLQAELSHCKDEIRARDELIAGLEDKLDVKDHQIEQLETKVDEI